MTLPSCAQIDKARTPLRQAYEIAIAIEAAGSYAPENIIDAHKVQFIHNLRNVARELGLELVRRPNLRVAVNNDPDTITIREFKG